MQAKLDEFQKGIDRAWNDRFQICCDKIYSGSARRTTLIKRNPPDPSKNRGKKYIQHTCCCDVVFKIVQNEKGPRVGLFDLPNPGNKSSTQFDWNMTQPSGVEGETIPPGQVAAHEFGHYLGNIDEYGGASGGRNATGGDYGQNPVDGGSDYPNSIMRTPSGIGDLRHLWRIEKEIGSVGEGCKFSCPGTPKMYHPGSPESVPPHGLKKP